MTFSMDAENNNAGQNEILAELSRTFPKKSSVNLGIVLIGSYFIMEFGSIQMLFPVVNQLRFPLMISGLSILYAGYLFITGSIDFNEKMTKIFPLLCLFIVIYSFLATKISDVSIELVKAFIGFLSGYLIAVATIKKLEHYFLLIDIWLGSIMFSCTHGILQGGKIWGSMWLKDENTISLLAAMAMPFAFMLFKNSRSKIKKLFYLLCMAIYVGLTVVAHSRGGALSMGIVMVFLWHVTKNRIRNLFLVIVVALIGISYLPDYFVEEMKTLEQGTEEGTAADRIYLWGICLEMFSDNPVLGVGPANYPYYFSSYEKGKKYQLGTQRPAHTTPLQWLAEMGIVGATLLLMVLYAFWRNYLEVLRLCKQNQDNTVGKDLYYAVIFAVMVAFIAFWFGSIFLSLMPYPFFWCLPYFSQAWKTLAEKQFVTSR
jgi:O-antigen ligase